MKLSSYLIILSVLLFTFSCKNSLKKETAFDREGRLINEYHRKAVEKKGSKTFYIPKEEVSWYFKDKEVISYENAIVGDNVSFFDTTGNIQYQAVIDTVKDKIIYINCLDLKRIEYYVLELKQENIKDLDKEQKYKIRIFR